MGRPIPQGRDRLGILGGPVGANAALSDTDAEYTIGTSDFMVAATFKFAPQDNVGAHTAGEVMWCSDGAVDWYLFVRASDDRMAIWIDGGTYYGTIDSGVIGRTVDMMVFCDRDGDAYFYLDGAENGSDDISAKSASDFDGTVLNIGGVNGGYGRIDVVSKAVIFKLSGTFPTADERAAIARERYLNPDTESPTLAARTDYATERRVDVDFVDIDQDGTTVTNNGTGGDFTIGGGLQWREVRTQAERTAIAIPDEDWRAFDATHRAAGSADLGLAQGAYVCELVYRDGIVPLVSIEVPLYIVNAGTAERLEFDKTSAGAWTPYVRTNGVFLNARFQDAGYSDYGRSGINVLHWVLDADADTFQFLINGQHLEDPIALATELDLSGVLTMYFDDNQGAHNILALRLWNWAGAVAPPAGWEDVLRQRVMNPWTRDGHDFDAAAIKGEWECRINAADGQGAASTVLKNLANPGTGDLTIGGGGTMGDSTKLAVRGRS